MRILRRKTLRSHVQNPVIDNRYFRYLTTFLRRAFDRTVSRLYIYFLFYGSRGGAVPLLRAYSQECCRVAWSSTWTVASGTRRCTSCGAAVEHLSNPTRTALSLTKQVFQFFGIKEMFVFFSVADPWNFGTDSDPRIRTSEALTNEFGYGSCCFRQSPKMFLLITFWRYIYIIFQR